MAIDANLLETTLTKNAFFRDLQEEIPGVVSRFFDILLPAAFSFGGIALAASLYRSLQYGWYATLALHTAMYLFSLGALLFRRKIPARVMFFLFFGMMALVAVHSLYTMGLSGEGMMTLSLLCAFAGLFFGIRAGIISIVVGITTACLIGGGICTGIISIHPAVVRMFHEPASWMIYSALFLMFMVPFILIVNHMHKKMASHLHALKEMNACLREEVAARVEIENKLLESELKYRSVVENSFVAFYIVQDDVYRFVNSRFFSMTGYTYDELIDKLGPVDITHPDDRQKISDNIRIRLAGGNPDADYESKIMKKDGSPITVKVMGSLFSYNRKPAIFGALIDITNEKLLESKLIQSQKMEAVGTLAGGIAHDFNNILSALMGFGTMLHMKIKDSDPLKRYTSQILSAAEKASSLTHSLLTFSRLQPVASKPVCLNSVILETEELLKRIITEDIDFDIELGQEKIVILADVIHVNQILFNLVSNAKDAMLAGGRLKISTEVVELGDEFIRVNGFGKKGTYALLSVSDTGTGMDEQTIQKIFDPFFTTKEVGKGTGLGLSSVYGIVKRHHGYVAVDSEKNRGTCFHIYFPVIKDDIGTDQSENDADHFTKGEETILVAEDDDVTRLFIKELLTDFGYKIIEAVDGEDALEKFRNCDDISLVILDSVMPKKNGRVLYDTIKKIRPEVRTLFMSGYTKEIVLSKGIIDNSSDFMAKPIYPDKFLAKVREILDRPEG